MVARSGGHLEEVVAIFEQFEPDPTLIDEFAPVAVSVEMIAAPALHPQRWPTPRDVASGSCSRRRENDGAADDLATLANGGSLSVLGGAVGVLLARLLGDEIPGATAGLPSALGCKVRPVL